jgi:hypothetical protein
VGEGKSKLRVSLTHWEPIGSTEIWLNVAYAAYVVGHVRVTPSNSQVIVWDGGGSGSVWVVLLTSFPALSVKMSTVTRGRVVVSTITVPGYTRRVAVTSIWQSVVQEMEGGGLEGVSGEEVTPGVNVWTIVVGTSSVVVISTVERTVETIVEAGTWVVTVCVDPGCVKVLVVICPGSVIVERKLVVTVLAGSVVVKVWVVPGRVIVDNIVLAGTIKVDTIVTGGAVETMVSVIGGTTVVLVIVENIVLGGSWIVTIWVGPGTVEVITVVEGGSTIVVREVETEVETLVIVSVVSMVLVTTEISVVIETRVISSVWTDVGPSIVCTEVGPGTVWIDVGPGTVSVETIVSVNERVWVEVVTTGMVVGTRTVTVVVPPGSVLTIVVVI